MGEALRSSLLVVEDDRAIRLLLVRLAQREGFEVDQAEDGSDALALLSKRSYDVAVVDLTMPRVSGYEVLQHIARMPPPLPIVLVVTALANGDVAIDDTLVRRLIRKPFDLSAMSEALADAARRIAERRSAPLPAAMADEAILLPSDTQSPISPPSPVATDSPAVSAPSEDVKPVGDKQREETGC